MRTHDMFAQAKTGEALLQLVVDDVKWSETYGHSNGLTPGKVIGLSFVLFALQSSPPPAQTNSSTVVLLPEPRSHRIYLRSFPETHSRSRSTLENSSTTYPLTFPASIFALGFSICHGPPQSR